jgi:hypothetical protein
MQPLLESFDRSLQLFVRKLPIYHWEEKSVGPLQTYHTVWYDLEEEKCLEQREE